MNNENLSTSISLSRENRSEITQQELQQYYREASHEIDPLFELATADGLDDGMELQ